MIVDGQLIEINGASKRLYLDKGYTYKKGEPLYVRAEDWLSATIVAKNTILHITLIIMAH